MDRERAETYLRLLAEAELRRATTIAAGSLPGRWRSARLELAVRALSAVGAVGADAADADFRPVWRSSATVRSRSYMPASRGPFVSGYPDHPFSEGKAEVTGVCESGSGKLRTPEVGTSLEAWLTSHYGAKVRTVQIAIGKVRPAQVRVFEVGAPKICAMKVCVLQACSPKVGARQIETAYLRGIAAVIRQRRTA